MIISSVGNEDIALIDRVVLTFYFIDIIQHNTKNSI